MSIRSRMTMRATVERDVGTTEDPYGSHEPNISIIHGGAPLDVTWESHPLSWGLHEIEWGSSITGSLPCYVQPRTERTVTREGKFIAVTMLGIWAPVDADLENEDVVTSVKNLAGTTLYDGKRRVTALIRRETHLDGILEYYG